MNNLDSAELRTTAYQMLEMADQIDAASRPVIRKLAVPVQLTPSAMRVEIQRCYALRSKRNAILGDDLFGEPAWDILLALYVDTVENKQPTVTSLCHASRVASTTALRYLKLMSDKGWITRHESATDGRVSHITMSDSMFVQMSLIVQHHMQRGKKAFPTDPEAYLIEKQPCKISGSS